MARGRSNFGTRFKGAKRSSGSSTKVASSLLAATAAASHEVARQSKKNAKRGGSSRAVSPEYAAAVRLAEEERWAEIDRSVQEDKERRAEQKAKKEAERAERLAKNPPKPPKSPTVYRVLGGIFVALGLLLLVLFWPLGIAVAAWGVWWIVSARKVYSGMVERYVAAHPDFGAENGTGK